MISEHIKKIQADISCHFPRIYMRYELINKRSKSFYHTEHTEISRPLLEWIFIMHGLHDCY